MNLPSAHHNIEAAPASPVPLPATLASGLRTAADTHAEGLRPANTVRAYQTDWCTWTSWCTEIAGVSEWSVDAALMEAYCRWLWHDRGYARSTIDRKLTGAVAVLRATFGQEQVPRHLASRARKNLAAYARDAAADRQPPRGRGQAPVADLGVLMQLLAAARTDPTPAGTRDAALMLVAFGTGARSAEISGLLIDDVTIEAERGLRVNIRTSKVTASLREVAIARGMRAATDPVTAWRSWIHVAGHEPGDPAFLRIRKGGRIMSGLGLSPEAVSDIIARRAKSAGLDRYTIHGLRAGMATVARAHGKSDTAIADQGGWTRGSRAMHSYLRRSDMWDDNPTTGVL